MKDKLDSAATLAVGAAKEAALNVGWDVFERLATTMIKALKDEMVDLFITSKALLRVRLTRFLDTVWGVIKQYRAPLSILKGIFEFVLNALSQAIGKIYPVGEKYLRTGHVGDGIGKRRENDDAPADD
ncbi:hypothetical protein CWS02_14105 [Enterobacter sp. EA-1]|nr:hypothetical protein CWS02_14105 [Enterobacter sp. EA-1]